MFIILMKIAFILKMLIIKMDLLLLIYLKMEKKLKINLLNFI